MSDSVWNLTVYTGPEGGPFDPYATEMLQVVLPSHRPDWIDTGEWVDPETRMAYFTEVAREVHGVPAWRLMSDFDYAVPAPVGVPALRDLHPGMTVQVRGFGGDWKVDTRTARAVCLEQEYGRRQYRYLQLGAEGLLGITRWDGDPVAGNASALGSLLGELVRAEKFCLEGEAIFGGDVLVAALDAYRRAGGVL